MVTTKFKVMKVSQIITTVIAAIAFGFAVFFYAYMIHFATGPAVDGAGLGAGVGLILYIVSSAIMYPISMVSLVIAGFSLKVYPKLAKVILIINIVLIASISIGYLVLLLL